MNPQDTLNCPHCNNPVRVVLEMFSQGDQPFVRLAGLQPVGEEKSSLSQQIRKLIQDLDEKDHLARILTRLNVRVDLLEAEVKRIEEERKP